MNNISKVRFNKLFKVDQETVSYNIFVIKYTHI